MANPNLWGAEHLVNTSVINTQQSPQVAALEGGGHVIVWSSVADGQIHAQIYDAFGLPVGTQLSLTPGIIFAQGMPHVAAVPGGGFAVSYSGHPNNFAQIAVQTAVFDKLGAPATGPLLVDAPPAGQQQQWNAISALGDGGYAVAYITFDSNEISQSLAVQRFNADGTKLGTAIAIGVDAGSTTQHVQIADVGGGRFAVIWDAEDDIGDRNVYAQIVDYAGAKQGGVFPVNAATDAQTAAGVAGDGSGKFLVAFHDTSDQLGGGTFQGLVQLYGANNAELPTGPNDAAGPAQVSDPGQNSAPASSPVLTALHGGGYLAVWFETPNTNIATIVGQLVDSSGNRVGGEFIIKEAASAAVQFYEPALTTLADGRVVLTWFDSSGTLGDSDLGVHSQIIDPRFGTISGTAASETLLGSVGSADDTLTSGAGSDTLIGGLGNDTYVLTGADDVAVEAADAGLDTIVAAFDYTLGAHFENLTLAAGSKATGNAAANALAGNTGANILDGKAGNDTMTGLAGDDQYVVTEAGDVVVEAANAGTDTVTAYLDHTLAANVEKLVLAAGHLGKGNGLANTLTGNAAANLLDGQGGADTMSGGLGDDGYIVAQAGDLVVEGANAGSDTVYAAISYTLGANIETLVLTGNAGKGTGNDAANALTGNAGANTLSGGKGNDTLDGGKGTDVLEGGKGNDTYVLGSAKDKVIDSGGADDTITSTASRKLAAFAGIENLTLLGTGNIKGTGNGKANDLVGNAGRNELKGGGGDDLLRGGLGKDLLWGEAGKDIFDFNAIAEIGKSKLARDVIEDFQHRIDRIDLKSIDANALAAGNNRFKFVAAEGSKFGGVAGQLIWDQKDKAGIASDVTLVSGDINGDKVADFTLELHGLVSLSKADFIL